ncbi:MAG TPA: hypothetical protein VGC51_12325 [Hansschlegelia sp.]
MSAAFVIEVRGRQAGLIVRDGDGRFRFFSAIREAFPLEGEVFRTAAEASRAVSAAMARPKSVGGDMTPVFRLGPTSGEGRAAAYR